MWGGCMSSRITRFGVSSFLSEGDLVILLRYDSLGGLFQLLFAAGLQGRAQA